MRQFFNGLQQSLFTEGAIQIRYFARQDRQMLRMLTLIQQLARMRIDFEITLSEHCCPLLESRMLYPFPLRVDVQFRFLITMAHHTTGGMHISIGKVRVLSFEMQHRQ